WSINHDVLYSLLCISFFADQEIDESEKDAIFKSYNEFVIDVTNESFNIDFGMTTEKFIELQNENDRQTQFDVSLDKIKKDKSFTTEQLEKLISAYIDIANADDFIHDNEVTLIDQAIKSWELNISIQKPKSGEKLSLG
ncbi:MAG: TerB family tellurite resistance protein, partial [Fidelibacterota bacterium]